MSSSWRMRATLNTIQTPHCIYILFLFILSLSPITSQQCDNGINDDYIGFYFNPPTNPVDTDPFSPHGLSKFANITFNIMADCVQFTNPNTSTPPIMYLSITTSQPTLDINIFENWLDIAQAKAYTLEETIPDFTDKSQVFNFILDNWDEHLLNLTNETQSFDFDAIPNWYNIWLLTANTNQIAYDCNNSDSTAPIETTITFEWTPYTQFFPIFQNFDITNTQDWFDQNTNLPYEIIWNDEFINTTLYYNTLIFNDDSEWITCFHVTNLENTDKDWQVNIETYSYQQIDSNLTYLDSLLDYTLYSDVYIPLIAYNNCNVSYRVPTEEITENKDKKCYENTCCKYDGAPHRFNIYFWYDDDVWTNSLALYQLLTQYVIEEALCDTYNEIYSDTLEPSNFLLSVTFFFNFCLLKNGGCPNYEQEKSDGLLSFFPPGIDSNNEISGYKMYATFRTKPLEKSEKIWEMLAENKENAYTFQSHVVRRAKEDFGRHNFDLFGIAISRLPQRIIFAVPQYINYAVWGFVGFCTVFAIAGAIHGFVYWGADCIRISGIVYFGLYTWDFYSDIVFDLELLNYSHIDNTEWLFYACTAFIAIPWIANMFSLSKYQQKWCKDDAIRERVYSWFVSWQRLTYALAAVSGSAFGTVELANSYVFGMDFFCMGLNERHLKRFNNNRLWSGIIAENFPQIIIQFYFLSLLDWEPESSIVWLAIISSSLSIGAALLDIYSAKKLFDVLEPNGESLGKVTCSMIILSYEIRENAKKLQVSTYALRDAIAETLTAHRRSVEMHFPIKTSDGLKIGFTVFSSHLQPKVIYERLRKNATPLHVGETAELPKKIKKVWRLEGPIPEVPVKDITVDGVDTSEYDDGNFDKNTINAALNDEGNDMGTGAIEMVNLSKPNIGTGDIDEGNAVGMIDAFKTGNINTDKTIPLNDANNKEVSDYDAQIASLNAQIAMNQYLMMKQIERMKDNNDNNANDNKIKKLQELMMKQMQQMNNMINMSKPYDAIQFEKFNNEWEHEQNSESDNGNNNDIVNGNNYRPPQLSDMVIGNDDIVNNNDNPWNPIAQNGQQMGMESGGDGNHEYVYDVNQ